MMRNDTLEGIKEHALRIITIKKPSGSIMHGAFDDESVRDYAGKVNRLSVSLVALCDIHKNHFTGTQFLLPSKEDQFIPGENSSSPGCYIREGLNFSAGLKHFLAKKVCSTCVRISQKIVELDLDTETVAFYLKLRVPLRDWDKVKGFPSEWLTEVYRKVNF